MYRSLHRALIAAQCKIVGRRFGGLTLWHLQLLEAVESPILGGSDMPVIPQDLLVIAEIVNAKYPNVPRFRNSLTRCFWGEFLRGKRLREASRKLQAWLDNELSFPSIGVMANGKSEGSVSTAPPHLSTAQAVAKGTCTPITDVWNMRLAEVRWLEAVIAEAAGAKITFGYELSGAKITFGYELSEEQKNKPKFSEEDAREVLDRVIDKLPSHLAAKFKKGEKIKTYGV